MKNFLTLLFFLIMHDGFGQPMFRKTYGFGQINEGLCAIQCNDHGYAITGSTTPGWGGQTNAYLVKTDSVGNAVFHYSYGNLGIEKATAILQLPDSGFLMAGYSNGFGVNNDYDGMLIRTDKNGDQLWLKTFGTADWDFINDMQFTADGNCILAGISYGSGSGLSAGYVVKVDYSGNLLWEKFISNNLDVNVKQILSKADGSLTICGKLEDASNGKTDAYVMFLDANGDSIHSTIVDKNNKNECFNAIGNFSNGDIVVVGEIEDTGNVDELLMRIDINGNEIWYNETFYIGQEPFTDLFIKNDTLIAAGNTTTFAQGGNDFRFALFTEASSFITGNTFGGSEDEFSNNVIVSNDGGYLFLGTSTTYGPGQQSVLFVKSDTVFTYDPNVSINVDEIQNTSLLAYPNPTTGIINISSPINTDCDIRLYDLTGKLVLDKRSVLPTKIDIEQPGIYFLHLDGDTFTTVKKIVVNR